jgi:uncharacterized membrane protein
VNPPSLVIDSKTEGGGEVFTMISKLVTFVPFEYGVICGMYVVSMYVRVELITHWIAVTVKVIKVVQDVAVVVLAVEVVLGTSWVLLPKELSTRNDFLTTR